MQGENRYDRQQLLPEIGEEGQQRLRDARVLLVGAGGLGSPMALYLVGAGIGTLGIVDDDAVSVTNLHRQVLYGERSVGRNKAVEAASCLGDLNPEVRIEPHALRLAADNARQLVASYDLVLDGCDNFATRFLLDDVCGQLGKPYFYGAVCGFEGQASVFHCGSCPHSYRELHPDEAATLAMPHPGKGVVGMAPAVVGSVLAAQAVMWLCGHEPALAGRLWSVDLRTMQTFLIDL